MMYSQNDHTHDCSRRCNKLNKLSDKVGLEIEIKQLRRLTVKTLPKAQRTRGLSSSCESHIASSNANLDRISSSES